MFFVVIALAAIAFAIYKHVTLSDLKADVALAKSHLQDFETSKAKALLEKWL